MPTITTFLGYNDRAEEAINHYVSIFKNSRIHKIVRYGEGAPLPAGTALTIEFELDGQPFLALNGGPHFTFTDGISLAIAVETQAEVDHYTSRLIEGGGEEGPCGWVKDRFGLSWQVTPKRLVELLASDDKAKAGKAMQAMLQMKRIDLRALEAAVGS